MIDYFALGLTHALMALTAWRLMARADLDRDDAPAAKPRKRWRADDTGAEPGDA